MRALLLSLLVASSATHASGPRTYPGGNSANATASTDGLMPSTAFGRLANMVIRRWVVPAQPNSGVATTATTVAKVYIQTVWVDKPCTTSTMGYAAGATAVGNLIMGIYGGTLSGGRWSGLTGDTIDGAGLVEQTADTAQSAGFVANLWNTVALGSTVTLNPGQYAVAFVASSAATPYMRTLQGENSANGMTSFTESGGTYAALPSTVPATSRTVSNHPAIGFLCTNPAYP